MAAYKRIPLKRLEVNPSNDRHGVLVSEKAAIEWLLLNKKDKMNDLLQDIIHKNGIVEEPLVMKKKGENKYTVFDGNRRITCLKLLLGIAPEGVKNPFKKKIELLKKGGNFEIDSHIECRVEDDISLINDILELRHIPGNSGAGRLKWDGHEKETFLDRTGKSKKINFAKEINQILIEKNYLNQNDRIPLSTFNRLFSSKENKRKAGVEIQNNEIHLINDSEKTYKVLTRIAKDTINGKKTLDDLWDSPKKNAYFDELENEGLLPSAQNRLKKPIPAKNKDQSNDSDNPSIEEKPTTKKTPKRNDYLLPTNIQTPKHNTFFTPKFCQLHYELQNTLRFSNHLISISISFRAYLEILTISYLKKNTLNEKGSLALKIKSAFSHMEETKKFPEETKVFIKKLSDENEYFSINTLHKVTHQNFQISDNDLRSFVNNLDAFFNYIISDINKT